MSFNPAAYAMDTSGFWKIAEQREQYRRETMNNLMATAASLGAHFKEKKASKLAAEEKARQNGIMKKAWEAYMGSPEGQANPAGFTDVAQDAGIDPEVLAEGMAEVGAQQGMEPLQVAAMLQQPRQGTAVPPEAAAVAPEGGGNPMEKLMGLFSGLTGGGEEAAMPQGQGPLRPPAPQPQAAAMPAMAPTPVPASRTAAVAGGGGVPSRTAAVTGGGGIPSRTGDVSPVNRALSVIMNEDPSLAFASPQEMTKHMIKDQQQQFDNQNTMFEQESKRHEMKGEDIERDLAFYDRLIQTSAAIARLPPERQQAAIDNLIEPMIKAGQMDSSYRDIVTPATLPDLAAAALTEKDRLAADSTNYSNYTSRMNAQNSQRQTALEERKFDHQVSTTDKGLEIPVGEDGKPDYLAAYNQAIEMGNTALANSIATQYKNQQEAAAKAQETNPTGPRVPKDSDRNTFIKNADELRPKIQGAASAAIANANAVSTYKQAVEARPELASKNPVVFVADVARAGLSDGDPNYELALSMLIADGVNSKEARAMLRPDSQIAASEANDAAKFINPVTQSLLFKGAGTMQTFAREYGRVSNTMLETGERELRELANRAGPYQGANDPYFDSYKPVTKEQFRAEVKKLVEQFGIPQTVAEQRARMLLLQNNRPLAPDALSRD